jgi:hypothetical protein
MQARQAGQMIVDLLTLARHPFRGLDAVVDQRRPAQGMAALLTGMLLPALAAEVAAFRRFELPGVIMVLPSTAQVVLDAVSRTLYRGRFLIPLLEALAGMAGWLLAIGLIHLTALRLSGKPSAQAQPGPLTRDLLAKGKPQLRGLATSAGYIAGLGAFMFPLLLMGEAVQRFGSQAAASAFDGLVFSSGCLLFAWQNVLLVYAVRRRYRVSSDQATVAVLGPIGTLVLLLIALTALAATMAVLSVRSS